MPAKMFCTIIRGTPLLLQLWLLYYGLGSLFPQFPWIRESFLWPYLRQAWPYAVLSLTLSYAGYEGEVMRGAFAGVPRGQLEAARAFGMSRWKMFRRIWLPQALHRALPTLAGETVLQLQGDAAGGDDHHGRHLLGRLARPAGDVHHLRAAAAAGARLSVITGILVFAFRKLEARIPRGWVRSRRWTPSRSRWPKRPRSASAPRSAPAPAPDVALSLARSAVAAEAGGQPSVGLSHFIDYLEALEAGRIDGKAVPDITRPAPAIILSDAKGGAAHPGFDAAFD